MIHFKIDENLQKLLDQYLKTRLENIFYLYYGRVTWESNPYLAKTSARMDAGKTYTDVCPAPAPSRVHIPNSVLPNNYAKLDLSTTHEANHEISQKNEQITLKKTLPENCRKNTQGESLTKATEGRRTPLKSS